MKLALGTAQFGLNYGVANTTGRVAKDVADSVLHFAHQAGMNTLDTAIAYGDSEAVLGSIGVKSWKVITKLPALPDNCIDVQEWVVQQVLGSMKRLGVERLYGLLLHRPVQLLEGKGRALYDALESLKAAGLVQKIGISVYGPAELDSLFDHFSFNLVQAPLNILDRSLVDSGWADMLKQADVEVHTRSAFLQGLLLMPAHTRPAKFARWAEIWRQWDNWLASTGLTSLQACLRYANGLSSIDRVVVGVDTVDQLKQTVCAANGQLPSLPMFNILQDDRLINPASWSQL